MRTKLITALRLTANAIENGTLNYDWNKTEACNCGALACTLMGVSRVEMKRKVSDLREISGSGNWKRIVPNFCPITGLPSHEVLRAMADAGLSPTEIIDLEFLSNQDVQSRMRCRYKNVNKTVGALWWKKEVFVSGWHENQKAAVDYMRTWADLIQEQERDDSPSKNELGSGVLTSQTATATQETKQN